MSDDDGIFKVQTVPPPPGEADAYNAPTRVGAMAASIVEEVVLHAKRQAESAAMRANMRTATEEDGKVVVTLPIPRPTQSPIITTLSTPLPVPTDTDLHGEPAPVGAVDVDSTLEEAKEIPSIGPFKSEIVLDAAESSSAQSSSYSATVDEAIGDDAAPPALPTFEQAPGGSHAPSVRRSYVPVLLFALSALSFALYWLRRH